MTGTAATLAAGAAALLLLPVVLLGAAASVFSSEAAPAAPSATAVADIPPGYLALYVQAAATCPGLPWNVLAAIGKVESNHGRDPSQKSSADAVGPMQFLPATFSLYAMPVPPGGATPPTPWNPADAIYAAARLLCANGARNGTAIPASIFAYNHSRAYVNQVLSVAASYGGAPAAPSQVAARVIAYAYAQLGEPYLWGAAGPDAFDCSGLAMMAYRAAGIAIPRTTFAQWAAGQEQPGDLVFFAGSDGTTNPGHVGIVVGDHEMVDAPQPGETVRVDQFSYSEVSGFTRPGAVTTSKW